MSGYSGMTKVFDPALPRWRTPTKNVTSEYREKERMRPEDGVRASAVEHRGEKLGLSVTAAVEHSAPTVHWLNSADDAEWDEFVSRHPLGLVYHLSAWRRVLEDAFPHIRGQFLVLRDNADGSIQAGLPIYTVKSWLLGNSVTSIPFASFCDPLVSTADEFRLLLPELKSLHERSRSRRLEVRSNKLAAVMEGSTLTPHSAYKSHWLSLEKSENELLSSFARSSIRQKMNKAAKDGVTVEEREDEAGMDLCHSILEETRSRLALPVLPRAFFQAMRRWLWPKHLKVFIAMHEKKPVAFHLVLTFKELWISEYSGDTQHAISGVNQLLYWETMKRAKAHGATCFSFGRTSATNEGLLNYKRRWSPEEEDLVDFSLAAAENEAGSGNAREKSIAYRLVRTVLSTAPKPVYRMIGDYCYRHLG
jgi:CelD/BcsL family acetyltransferase involved in cellulose biosynthesis